MSYAINRGWRSRRAGGRRIALGLTGGLLVLPFGFAATAAAAADLRSNMQLAQAATAPPAAAAEPGSANQQLGELHSRLNITPAQQPQFDAFAQVMRQNEAAMDRFMQQNPPGQPRNALDELRAQAQGAELEARGLQRLLPVFQALYASLSPPQQHIADQLFATSSQGAQSPTPPGR